MGAFITNVPAILGFGFLGLSFLFVFLAYKNVKQIVGQKEPNKSAVDLSRFFMKTALGFMICAGPLQWVSVFLENYYSNKKINLVVTMTHPEWEKAFGDILVIEKGEPHPVVNTPYKGSYGDGDEIQLNAGKVAAAIRKIRSQVVVVNTELQRKQAISPMGATPRNSLPSIQFDMLDGG